MSKLKSLVIEIQDAIVSGLSYETIARQFDVPVHWVIEAADMMDEPSEPSDSMDGDFDSAMASAGYGMDEDYGYAEDVL